MRTKITAEKLLLAGWRNKHDEWHHQQIHGGGFDFRKAARWHKKLLKAGLINNGGEYVNPPVTEGGEL